jgi:ribose/xylose/arabinose/galactoside ABC-type transport system permease subunit
MNSSTYHRWLRRRESGLAILIALVAFVVSFVDPAFLQVENLRDILVRSAPTAIVACGVMLVVVTGEIDISVGSLLGLLAAVMGILVSNDELHWPLWIGLPVTLVVGTGVGLVTGLLVTMGRVPSIIATLGLLSALRGVTMLVMGGKNIAGLPESLSAMTKYGLFGIPLSLWVAALVIVMTAIVIDLTPLGRQLFAVGSSSYSARMLGLSERRLKLIVFANVGFLTALATIVDVPRLPKIEAGIGVGFELLVVTCVVVGGVSISGGRGTIWGVLLAVVLMTMVRPVLTYLDVGESGEKWTKAIQGGFIILAVVADSLQARGRVKRGAGS